MIMSDIVKKDETILPMLMEQVEDKIAVIRNVDVIADADVAALYGVETREINQAVRNNRDKFPTSYMFELSNNELNDLRCKLDTYSSDSSSFSASGVPACTFARLAPFGGSTIHNHYDTMEHLDPDSFMITLNFALHFANQLANTTTNLIPRKFDETITKKLEEQKKMFLGAIEEKKEDKKEEPKEEKETEEKKDGILINLLSLQNLLLYLKGLPFCFEK